MELGTYAEGFYYKNVAPTAFVLRAGDSDE